MLQNSQKQLAEKLSNRSPQDPVVREVLSRLDGLIRVDLSIEDAVMRQLARGYAELSKGRTWTEHPNIEMLMDSNNIIKKIRGIGIFYYFSIILNSEKSLILLNFFLA